MSLLLALALWTGSAFSATDHSLFTNEECQQLLKKSPSNDPAVIDQVDELMSWISMRHTVIRQLLGRAPGLVPAFDLLFLTTGFLLPPPETYFARLIENVPMQHWDRTLIPRPKHYDDFGLKRTKVRRQIAARWKDRAFDENLIARVEFVSILLTESMKIVSALANESSHTGLSNHDEPEVKFNGKLASEYLDRDAAYYIHWQRSFTYEELERVGRLRGYLADNEVRRGIVHRLNLELNTVIDDQQKLCGELRPCSSAEDFRAIYLRLKGGPMLLTGRPSALDKPKISASHIPPQFSVETIEEFLRDRKALPRTTLEQAPLFDVLADLQAAADLLGKSLIQLATWRADKFEWNSWRITLEPNIGSVDRLRRSLSERGFAITAAKREFARAAQALIPLQRWVIHTRNWVGALDKSEHRVERLTREQRLAFSSVMALAPNLERLLENALASIELRGEIMVEQLAAIANTLVVVGGLVERQVRHPNRDEDLEGTQELLEVVKLLESGEAI